jgi:16S rRNA processing protein RimM
MERDRILVAEIGAPHGLRGEVRLWSFTADPLAVKSYGPLQTADGREFEIEALRPAKDHFVARLRGIKSRDAAECLRNTKLYIPRAKLPALEEDEFYHADLIGLAAVTSQGAALGSVTAIHNFGAGDLIEIDPVGGGAKVMIPFVDAIVLQIDLALRRLIIDPLQGLLDGDESQTPPPVRGPSARSAGREAKPKPTRQPPRSLPLPHKGGGNRRS